VAVAFLAGERDPYQLAALRNWRVKASEEEIARSLEGNWQEDLLFVLQQEQDGYEFCQKQMAECDQRLQQYLQQLEDRSHGAGLPEEKRKERLRKKKKGNAPQFDLRAELFRMTGTDLTQIDGIDVTTTMTILSEAGWDMSVLGGGSSINAMVWMRGMQRDYDGWAENGAKGWAFADVLSVFKKQEDWEGGANEWRGSGGPIHIRRPKDPHPTAPAFIDAARQMGMPILDDVNGPMRHGAGYINMNIAADGTRVSAVRAFLRPALSRPNLTLLLNTNVVKLNFKGTRCVGVKLMTDGAVKDIAADKEVILAAGAINSPKLLMLGVGEAKALRSLGIDVVENLPGVGKNLQDHVLVSGVAFKYKGKMPDRPADSNAVEAEAYLSSGPSGDTDISLVLNQLPVVTPEVASRFGTPPPDTFTIAPALVQPTSRGSVRLASNKFQDAAVINGNYLGTDRDFAAIVRVIEAARELDP